MAPRFNPGARPCRILVGGGHRAEFGSGDPIQTPHPVNPVNLVKEPPSSFPNGRVCGILHSHQIGVCVDAGCNSHSRQQAHPAGHGQVEPWRLIMDHCV